MNKKEFYNHAINLVESWLLKTEVRRSLAAGRQLIFVIPINERDLWRAHSKNLLEQLRMKYNITVEDEVYNNNGVWYVWKFRAK